MWRGIGVSGQKNKQQKSFLSLALLGGIVGGESEIAITDVENGSLLVLLSSFMDFQERTFSKNVFPSILSNTESRSLSKTVCKT